jgi:transposase InsO family protein
MPWKECSVMDERLRFVAKLLDGESMTDVCREFGISRKTGYKIFSRYKEHGFEALNDRCRRPVRYANQLPHQVEELIVTLKREKPHWGARKIRELLLRRLDDTVTRIPAKSTIHAVLHRHGLVKAIGRPRHRASGTPLSAGMAPNELWCTDYKGEFKLGNGRYCYPLTVTDHASRYLLLCEALESTREQLAITAFDRLFRDRGLPQAIRSDNGVPFASGNSLFGLSRLSVWWLRLGISIERIKPGHPQQNGRHERMHLTLKKETTRPPGANSLQQQARFDDFVLEFNPDEFSHGGAKYWLCPWTSAMSKTAKGLTAGVVLSALWLVIAVSAHNGVPSICLGLAAIWLGISDWIGGRNRFRMTIREQFEQNRRGWPQPLPRVANVIQGAAYFLGAAALVYWIAM